MCETNEVKIYKLERKVAKLQRSVATLDEVTANTALRVLRAVQLLEELARRQEAASEVPAPTDADAPTEAPEPETVPEPIPFSEAERSVPFSEAERSVPFVPPVTSFQTDDLDADTVPTPRVKRAYHFHNKPESLPESPDPAPDFYIEDDAKFTYNRRTREYTETGLMPVKLPINLGRLLAFYIDNPGTAFTVDRLVAILGLLPSQVRGTIFRLRQALGVNGDHIRTIYAGHHAASYYWVNHTGFEKTESFT